MIKVKGVSLRIVGRNISLDQSIYAVWCRAYSYSYHRARIPKIFISQASNLLDIFYREIRKISKAYCHSTGCNQNLSVNSAQRQSTSAQPMHFRNEWDYWLMVFKLDFYFLKREYLFFASKVISVLVKREDWRHGSLRSITILDFFRHFFYCSTPEVFCWSMLRGPSSAWGFFNYKIQLTRNVRGPSYLGLTRSISLLLMPWLLASPGCRPFSYLRNDFKYLCHINVEEWQKM